MRNFIVVGLTILAVHFVTYVVVFSRITRAPREAAQNWAEKRWLARHPGETEDSDEWRSLLAYQLSCPWCVSPYVGAVIVTTVTAAVGLPVPVLVWLAASSVTGLLSRHD